MEGGRKPDESGEEKGLWLWRGENSLILGRRVLLI
jgi:hypothetical protein